MVTRCLAGSPALRKKTLENILQSYSLDYTTTKKLRTVTSLFELERISNLLKNGFPPGDIEYLDVTVDRVYDLTMEALIAGTSSATIIGYWVFGLK